MCICAQKCTKRSCYYQLRQLRVMSRSLSCSAAAALVHAFVTSRLDHCFSILANLPLAQTARLDRVLRCAARLIGRIPKYGSVSAYMRDTLHWLHKRKFLWTKFGSYSAKIDHDFSQSLVFYFIVDTV